MLLLRQACQPVLDSYGLNDLHVTIKDKTLTIVGGCGKPLVSIGGITFAKSSVSEKERTFAISLFEAFMSKHSAAIVKYVTEKKAFKALPELVPPTNWGFYSTHNQNFMKNVELPYNMLVYSSGHIMISQNGYFKTTPDELINTLKSIKKDIPACVKYLEDYDARREQAALLEQQRQALAVCDI